MSTKRPVKPTPPIPEISSREALQFGVMLLAQVSGTLLGAAILGFLVDQLAGTQPIGLAVGVVIGGAAATVTVLTKVKAKLVE